MRKSSFTKLQKKREKLQHKAQLRNNTEVFLLRRDQLMTELVDALKEGHPKWGGLKITVFKY